MLPKQQFSDDLVREPKLQLLDNLAPSSRNCNPKPKIDDLGAPMTIWGPRGRNYPNRSSATIWGLGGGNYSFFTIWHPQTETAILRSTIWAPGDNLGRGPKLQFIDDLGPDGRTLQLLDHLGDPEAETAVHRRYGALGSQTATEPLAISINGRLEPQTATEP